uniref:Taste receptor type 2 n=1 Tax=Ditylenchus dipsaci TaxID=166011 RepID=A0A915EMA7_9BILA
MGVGTAPLNNCSAALLLAKYNPLHYVGIGQALISLLTLFFLVLCFYSFTLHQRTKFVFLHPNLKLLLLLGALFYAIHSVFVILKHFLDEFYYFSHFQDPCNYQIITWKCLVLRIPIYFCVIGFTFLHLIIGALLYDSVLFSSEEYLSYKSYCMSTSSENSTKMLITVHILMVLDFMATVGDFVLMIINTRQLTSKSINYTLRKSYTLKENQLSICMVFPISVTHSVMFTIYLIFSTIVRICYAKTDPMLYTTLVELVLMTMCLYGLMTVMLFYFLRHRLDHSRHSNRIEPDLRDAADAYFQQFNKQWNFKY